MSPNGGLATSIGTAPGILGEGVWVPAASPHRLEAKGDFNADGKTDVVMCANHTVRVFLASPASPTSVDEANAAFSFSSTPFAGFCAVGDFNADGKPDVAVATSGQMQIALNTGSGLAPLTAFAGPSLQSLGVFDLDGVTGDDLFAVSNGGPALVFVLSNGDGTFAPALSAPMTTPLSSPVYPFREAPRCSSRFADRAR